LFIFVLKNFEMVDKYRVCSTFLFEINEIYLSNYIFVFIFFQIGFNKFGC